MTENHEQLKTMLQDIEKWEKDQKSLWFWERIGRIPFMLLDKFTPKFIQDKMMTLVDEIGGFVQTGGRYLISEKAILNRFAKHSGVLDEDVSIETAASMPIAVMDEVAEDLRSSRKNIAAVQGASTGVGGIFTLAADIPLSLGLALKTLQEIALAYGYDPHEKEERYFIIKCLQFASSDVVGKKAILEDLTALNKSEANRQAFSQIQGWREVLMTYRDNYGWKKLFQMIPIAGIVFGAFINRSAIDEVAETGMMLYKKRRVLERLN
ncbi:EcsC family protein [Fictibacillus iocasae]|uniref:EcsC family protein n=1 Tax=Fictibacillus iocasae TaxID=2715437 RepID=A0ABW2NJZ6_9BACL